MPARPILSTLCPLLLVVAGTAGAATNTAQTLGIKLQDPSTDSSIAHMSIVLDQDTIKPGRVILQAENQSRNLVHEVIIGRDDGAKQLPMDAKHDRVIESRVRRLGEIADLAPGKTGKLSLNLKPGNYVLFCNQPGHYQDGMVTRLTVAP
jgi:uncharacterized cupredoxin-like copper-binding protein